MSGALAAMWPMIKKLLPPDSIKEAAGSLINSALQTRNEYPLQPGEVAVINFQFEQNGIVYNSIGFVDETNRIVRQENIQTTDELIEKIINNM